MGGFGPPGRYDYERVRPPKGVADLPRYLKELVGGFFFRLFYIFGLVWHTGPWILFFMSFVAVFQGVIPVVGSLIMKNILNEMQNVVTLRENGGDAVFWGSAGMVLIFSLFVYRLISQVVPFLKNYRLCIYLFLAVPGHDCCTQAFSSSSKWGLLFFVVRGLLIAVDPFVVEHGL